MIYGISGVISSFISIFLIPLYTKIFQPADYGIISILGSTSTLLTILIIFGLDNSASVLYWDKEDFSERKKTFNSWFWATLFIGGVFMVLLVLLSQPLSLLFFSSVEYTLFFILMGINMMFAGFQKITNIWCRLEKQPVKAMMFSIVLLLFTVGLNILFILHWRMGISGVFYSQVAASFVGFGIMISLFRPWIDFRSFSIEHLKRMVTISLPLVPASILFWIMNMASVYFLHIYLSSTAEIGLYQIGASVANVLSLATWAFFQAWTPFALEVSKTKGASKVYSLILELYCVCGFFCAFALMLMGKHLLIVFTNSNYLAASTVLGLLGINVIIIGIPNILAIANNLVKNNSSYAIAIFLGALTTVALFTLLIPPFGKEGAALAMIAGNAAVAIYMSVKAQRLYYIPYNFPRIIAVVLLQLGSFLLASILTADVVTHVLATAAIGLLVGSFYYLKFPNPAALAEE